VLRLHRLAFDRLSANPNSSINDANRLTARTMPRVFAVSQLHRIMGTQIAFRCRTAPPSLHMPILAPEMGINASSISDRFGRCINRDIVGVL
jgi:hypothetical protein